MWNVLVVIIVQMMKRVFVILNTMFVEDVWSHLRILTVLVKCVIKVLVNVLIVLRQLIVALVFVMKVAADHALLKIVMGQILYVIAKELEDVRNALPILIVMKMLNRFVAMTTNVDNVLFLLRVMNVLP